MNRPANNAPYRCLNVPRWHSGTAASYCSAGPSSLPSQRITRLILCSHDLTLAALHGFIKKRQKTPANDLALAKRRRKETTK